MTKQNSKEKDLDQIQEEGYQAYLEGLPINECPYDQDSQSEEAIAWEGGWMAAEEEIEE